MEFKLENEYKSSNLNTDDVYSYKALFKGQLIAAI